ncbi:MAG: hypothetical protein ACLSHJ_00805 [Oscillospiraceae bacterium]
MTKNTPRIFISLLLMLLCIGILPVSAFASGGDYPDNACHPPSVAPQTHRKHKTDRYRSRTSWRQPECHAPDAGLDRPPPLHCRLPNGTGGQM